MTSGLVQWLKTWLVLGALTGPFLLEQKDPCIHLSCFLLSPGLYQSKDCTVFLLAGSFRVKKLKRSRFSGCGRDLVLSYDHQVNHCPQGGPEDQDVSRSSQNLTVVLVLQRILQTQWIMLVALLASSLVWAF